MKNQNALVKIEFVSALIVTVCMVTGAFISYINHNLAAAIIIIGALSGFAILWCKSRNLFNFLGLVYLGFVFPLGLANLRWANYQENWEVESWFCFIMAVVCFAVGYLLRNIIMNQLRLKVTDCSNRRRTGYEGMFVFGVIVFLCLLSGFFIKWWVAGSLPLFNWRDAHTYIYYLSGEGYLDTLRDKMTDMPFLFLLIKIYHRFSTIFMFQGWLASCAVYAYCVKCRPKRWKKVISWTIIAVSTIIPYLIVVREIFMMQTIAFAVFGFMINERRWKKYFLVFAMAVITMLGFVGMSRTRGYTKTQIAEVFEMNGTKDKNNYQNTTGKPGKTEKPGLEETEAATPAYPATVVWIYTYFTCGFDNFNYLTKTLDYSTYGLMELRPVFSALQVDGLMDVDMKLQDDKYRVSPNVTIYTFLCDAYVDFGVAGVIISMFIWGAVFGVIAEVCIRSNGAVSTILYGGIGHHIIFMAFVSWMGHFSYLCSFGLLFIYFMLEFMWGKRYGE